MDKPQEIRKRTHWLVLLFAGMLAAVDLAALCFSLATLFIAIARPRGDAGLLILIWGMFYGPPVLGVLLLATILFAVLAKRLAWAYRVVLLVLIAVGVVADAIAVWCAFTLPK